MNKKLKREKRNKKWREREPELWPNHRKFKWSQFFAEQEYSGTIWFW